VYALCCTQRITAANLTRANKQTLATKSTNVNTTTSYGV